MQLHGRAESSSSVQIGLQYGSGGGVRVMVVRRVGVVGRMRVVRRVGMVGRMRVGVVRGVAMGVAEVGRRRREDVGEVGDEEQRGEADEEELHAVHGHRRLPVSHSPQIGRAHV